MSCTDCFNGCAGGPTSDKCVKYTGVDQPRLNISSGDTLFSVEDNIIMKILDMMVGVGIFPEISIEDVCSQVNDELPPPTGFGYTLNDYLIAIANVACQSINDLIAVHQQLDNIDSPYTLSCLTGITSADGSDTHKVIQALITNLCALQTSVTAINNKFANYVAIADINNYIEAYISSTAPSNLISNNMIPYTAIEYYGPLSNFDASGSGIGTWARVFLCNGDHGTPDKRGVVPVGVTNMPGTKPFNPKVDPNIPPNPTYTITSGISGDNTITLTPLQIPAHSHPATSVISGTTTATVPFIQQIGGVSPGAPLTYNSVGDQDCAIRTSETAPVNTSGTIITTTIGNTGGGNSHSNIQPVLPCYYIMYIP